MSFNTMHYCGDDDYYDTPEKVAERFNEPVPAPPVEEMKVVAGALEIGTPMFEMTEAPPIPAPPVEEIEADEEPEDPEIAAMWKAWQEQGWTDRYSK